VPDHDSDLRRASELVAEAQRFVYEQKGKIIRLKTAGVDTSDAERTLQMFESNLKMFEEHRNALQSTRP
jgi:DNA modification methylase